MALCDAQGAIDRAAQLPLDVLPVGVFMLRLVVTAAGEEVVREAAVRSVEYPSIAPLPRD